jgi:hypothetical protein
MGDEMADEKKTCFVISPIGNTGSDIRKRADQILKYVIEPACDKCEYSALRADKISEPGIITRQIIEHVLNDPMVVADLTGSNGNVFYELALRHAVKKPFIQLIADGEKIPFDIAPMRTIFINHQDLDSVQQAKEDIVKQIRFVEGKPPEEIETPIATALDFQSLRQSGDPEQRYIAELSATMAEVRAEIQDIKRNIVAANSPKASYTVPSYFVEPKFTNPELNRYLAEAVKILNRKASTDASNQA